MARVFCAQLGLALVRTDNIGSSAILVCNEKYKDGSPARTRTRDRLINSQLLYQLSYWGTANQAERMLTASLVSVNRRRGFLNKLSLNINDGLNAIQCLGEIFQAGGKR